MSIRMTLEMKGDKQLAAILTNLLVVSADLRPILRRCVTVLRRSVNKTFSEGGRPAKWPDRWDALEGIFPNLKGKNVLKVSGRLRQAVVENPEVTITKDTLTYGTNLEYAKTQQFGGKSRIKVPEGKIRYRKSDGAPYVLLKTERGYFCKHLDEDGSFEINVRPRPFLQIFDEDVMAITKIFETAMVQAMKGHP